MEEEIRLEQEGKQKPSIVGMFHSPVEQFKRMKARPVIWGGLIIILILSLLNGIMGTFLTEQTLTNEFPGLNEEDLGFMVLVTKVFAVIASLIGPIIGLLIKTLILIVIGKIAQSTARFKQLFSMSIFIGVIGTVGVLINTAVVLFSGTNDVTMVATSLSSIIPSTGALAGLLNSIEIFSIWTLILTAIGMQVVMGISKKVSWILVVSYFIIITLIMVGSMVILDKFEAFM